MNNVFGLIKYGGFMIGKLQSIIRSDGFHRGVELIFNRVYKGFKSL